ncbi:PAS domain-containing protein [Halalkalibaculum sp. DA3122]|uniref:PAS domain-containing protein n=1 Tax=Halalkalibaculum sp. DA3122 TaxID=3373607 RepID=UPI00375538D4
MGKVYQVLLIEDDERDAELIEIELKKLKIEIELEIVHQRKQLEDRLENSPPDLIVSDYNLPSFNAIQALKLVREKDPHLPFILVSGYIGEEKAVDAMLEGASDYAMKSNLGRLGPAILREITNYEEQKQTTKMLSEARDRYQALIQSVEGIVWEADAETFEFEYVSPKSQKLLGYSPEEWLSKPNFWQNHIYPQDRSRALNFCHQKTREGENHAFEYRMMSANDEVVWLRDYVTVITKNGRPDRLRGLMVDITKEKKAEKQRDKAYQIAEIGHWELDLIHDKLHWSDTVKKLHEVELEYEPDLDSAISFYKEGKNRQKIREAVEHAIEDGEPFDVELKIITAENNERWVRAVGETEFRHGKCVRIFGSTQNITKRKEAEQKLRDVVEHSTNLFYRHDTDHKLTYVSPQAEQFLGCTPEEARQQWTEFVTDHPVNEEGFRHTQKAIETGRAQPSFPLQLQKANGEKMWVRVNEAPITENGQTVAVVGSLTDITEQKQLERLLEQAHKMARIGAWELDLKTEEIFWTSMTREIHEIDDPNFAPDLETGITFYKKGESRETIRRVVQRAITEGIPWDEELQIVTAKGNERWVRTKGEPYIVDGECVRLYGSFQDIHDRKEAEQKLQHVADNIPGAIFQYRLYPDGTDELMYLSKGAKELWGISPEMGMQHNELIWDQLPEADYQQVKQSIADSAEAMAHWNAQWRSRHPEKGIRWHEGNGIPRKLPDGSIVWDSIILDITEQKQAEQQITKINNKLKLAQEIASLGYWELDLETGNVYWSEQSYKIWEFDPKEVQLTTDLVFDRMHPDDREYFREQHEKTLETGQPLDLEHRILLPDGTVKWIHVLGELKTSAQGRPIAMEGTAQDITKEKEAQIQLEKAYQENETILESIGDAFFAVDENWIVTYWNKEAEQVLDKPKEEIIGKNLWEEYDDAVDLDFYTQYHKAVNENVSVSFEEYYPGVEKWFEVSAYPSKTGLSVYFRDITDKKKRVEKIRQVNERFDKVTEATNDAIWDFNVTEDELFWGKGFETLFGYDLDETNPTLDFLVSLIHPEDRGEVVQKIEEYMQPGTKTDWYQEYRFKKDDGSYAPVMDRAIFIRDNRGEVTRVVGAMTDLTRHKKNEEALRQLNRELEKHAEELAASNAELEQFAYVASHDLQEPLRMVSSFLKRLEKKYGDQLDEKARQYIDFAVDGAGRMRQIILDLLNYSRVGQHEFERQNLCLEELLNEILKLEHRAIEESGATVEWDPLPEIRAAETPVQQVFQNLIRNAIKYRRAGCEPEIHICGEETGTHWKFSVSDNGIGIREEFQENIFNIFQRLHTQEEYSGTGIGLAVSKKIVEKHGGEIWVESEPGEGSTFCFTIAKE